MEIDVCNKVIKKARWWYALPPHCKSVKDVPRGWHGTSNRQKHCEPTDTSDPPAGRSVRHWEVEDWVFRSRTGPRGFQSVSVTSYTASRKDQQISLILLFFPQLDRRTFHRRNRVRFSRLSNSSRWATRRQPRTSRGGLVLGGIT